MKIILGNVRAHLSLEQIIVSTDQISLVLTPTDPGVLSYLKTRGGAKKAPPEVSAFFGQFGSGFLKF